MPYFLTVHDIVAEARARRVLCQGRGSAANSIICRSLGITDVHPDRIGMVFERFISRHRNEPPDIDVDFKHERREEVIQWTCDRYGRDRAGLSAAVIHFRPRAAIREAGKVMCLSQDVIACPSGLIWGISYQGMTPDHLRAAGAGSGAQADDADRCANPRDHRLSLPPLAAHGRLCHPREQARKLFPSRDFH